MAWVPFWMQNHTTCLLVAMLWRQLTYKSQKNLQLDTNGYWGFVAGGGRLAMNVSLGWIFLCKNFEKSNLCPSVWISPFIPKNCCFEEKKISIVFLSRLENHVNCFWCRCLQAPPHVLACSVFHWPFWCSLNMSSLFPSHHLCSCCFLYLKHGSPTSVQALFSTKPLSSPALFYSIAHSPAILWCVCFICLLIVCLSELNINSPRTGELVSACSPAQSRS